MEAKRLILAASLFFMLSASLASASSVTVNLNLNSTEGTVYIPGQGPLPSGQASGTWSSPPKFYIASWLGETLAGLVFISQNPLYIAASPITGGHSLKVSAEEANSKVLLTFTRGDWEAIERMMPLITLGTFFSRMYPSFCCGLGTDNNVKMLLDYGGLMDLDSDMILNRGSHTLTVEHMGVQNGSYVIRISRG